MKMIDLGGLSFSSRLWGILWAIWLIFGAVVVVLNVKALRNPFFALVYFIVNVTLVTLDLRAAKIRRRELHSSIHNWNKLNTEQSYPGGGNHEDN